MDVRRWLLAGIVGSLVVGCAPRYAVVREARPVRTVVLVPAGAQVVPATVVVVKGKKRFKGRGHAHGRGRD